MEKVRKGDRSRMTVELSGVLNDKVDELARKLGMKKSDVIRLALSYISSASEAADENYKVGVWKEEDGRRIEREFIGL